MTKVVPLKAEHLKIILNDNPCTVKKYMTEEIMLHIESTLRAFTVLDDEYPVSCFGITDIYPGRAEAWTFFGKKSPHTFIVLFRAIKRALQVCNVRRVEAAIDIDYKEGHRWIKALGFELEVPLMKAYNIDGGDVSLYVRLS